MSSMVSIDTPFAGETVVEAPAREITATILPDPVTPNSGGYSWKDAVWRVLGKKSAAA
jgi:hypothetical protein